MGRFALRYEKSTLTSYQKEVRMKRGLVLFLVLFVAACGSVSNMGMFHKNEPRVLLGNENSVLLYDPHGIIPNSSQEIATKYCAAYNKEAEWQSRGGTDSNCISLQMNYCVTYSCK